MKVCETVSDFEVVAFELFDSVLTEKQGNKTNGLIGSSHYQCEVSC